MPLFEISRDGISTVEQTNFPREKDLQNLVEKNLETVFNCRLVASEFVTGLSHSGRIDTLALSEDNNPVIIEYKKVESSELVNQSLFYLHWIRDHKGDFVMAAQKALGSDVVVEWSDVRVICIAPNFKKYDLHAVQVMGANIELWKYRLFRNSSLYLEEVLQLNTARGRSKAQEKGSAASEETKISDETESSVVYSVEGHLEGNSEAIRSLFQFAREFILGLDPGVEEVPQKFYIAYRISQNIVCLEIKTKVLKLFLKLKSSEVENPPEFYRDVGSIGHYGTGDSEFTITQEPEFELVKPFIERAYNKVGS